MLFDFADQDFRRNPWPAYQELRAEGGVCFSPVTGCYLVTSYAGVRAGLSHPDLAADYLLRASRVLFGPNMLDTDGALHRALKRLVNPFFGATSVNRLTSAVIQPVVADTVARVTELQGKQFDFIDEIARQVPYLIMLTVMGIPEDDSEWLYRTIRPIVALLDYPPPEDRTPAEQARDELQAFCVELLSRRRRTGGEDTIIAQLASMIDTDTLTRAHALSSVLLMLVAGTETSISGISNIMHCALRWPAVAADSPVSAFVKESLRWEPPLHSVIRFAVNDVVIEGVRIARRRPVLLVIASANRDESVFADAERFDPVRDGRQAIPFGVGQHACPGSFLAEREFNALFSALTAAFQITVAGDQLPEIRGHVFRRPRALPVRASQVVSPNPREVVKN